MDLPPALTDSLNDAEIARRVQQGDRWSFRLLVERYTPKLERYSRTFLFTAQEREDLLQDIFLKAYIHLQQYDPLRPFSPWIYRIAHNTFVNSIRSKQRAPVFSVDWDMVFPHPFSKEKTDVPLKQKELTEELEECMAELEEKYREPLTLYHFEELSYEEISDILRIPISTVGVRITRARAKLKAICLAKGITL